MSVQAQSIEELRFECIKDCLVDKCIIKLEDRNNIKDLVEEYGSSIESKLTYEEFMINLYEALTGLSKLTIDLNREDTTITSIINDILEYHKDNRDSLVEVYMTRIEMLFSHNDSYSDGWLKPMVLGYLSHKGGNVDYSTFSKALVDNARPYFNKLYKGEGVIELKNLLNKTYESIDK